MEKVERLEAGDCKGLTPRMFVVNHGAEEKLDRSVAALLDPVDTGSIHFWSLPKEQFPKIHYHDLDEYWQWTRGRTKLTVRLPDGRSDTFEIGPGWICYCVRGVEHTHQPLEDWECYEFHGIRRPGVNGKHLFREF